jgi:hypothetical protein
MRNGIEEELYAEHRDNDMTRILYLFTRGHDLDD